jgi:hypothetical protein
MIVRSFTLVFAFLFTVNTAELNAQGFGIVIDDVDATAGEVVCVPVRAKGFDEILGFQFSTNFDPGVLTFKNTQAYGLSGLTALNFNTHQNNLLVVWDHPAGYCTTKADGEVLFEICFTVVGDLGAYSALTPGSMGFPNGVGGAEVYNCSSQNVWDAENNEPGSVTITAISQGSSSTYEARSAQPVFKLFPNPTSTSAQVLMDVPASGWALLRVTDSLGKTVWSSSTTLLEGENTLRIPAEALLDQGLYQVSLQTAHGISTQMLSVKH